MPPLCDRLGHRDNGDGDGIVQTRLVRLLIVILVSIAGLTAATTVATSAATGDGSPVVRLDPLATAGLTFSFGWSPNGRFATASDAGGFYIFDRQTGQRRLIDPQPGLFEGQDREVYGVTDSGTQIFASDGNGIGNRIQNIADSTSRLISLPADTGGPSLLLARADAALFARSIQPPPGQAGLTTVIYRYDFASGTLTNVGESSGDTKGSFFIDGFLSSDATGTRVVVTGGIVGEGRFEPSCSHRPDESVRAARHI